MTKQPSKLIDQRIAELGDWRGKLLARIRRVIKQADPDVVEEWKWRGVPVWSHDGILCTGETYKQVVKMTFAQGAALPDPKGLFNASLAGNTRRAIDFHESDTLDEKALAALVRAAVAQRQARSRARPPRKVRSPKAARKADRPRLLSGGNPQIAKADGDAPVQAYLAALSGWKRELGERLDALVARSVPGVHKAVKWNSPLYGIEGQGWFLGLHVFTRYLKLAFFRGASLRPLPPGASKSPDTRYLDIHEGDELDEAQLAAWVKQAAALPGWQPGRR